MKTFNRRVSKIVRINFFRKFITKSLPKLSVINAKNVKKLRALSFVTKTSWYLKELKLIWWDVLRKLLEPFFRIDFFQKLKLFFVESEKS